MQQGKHDKQWALRQLAPKLLAGCEAGTIAYELDRRQRVTLIPVLVLRSDDSGYRPICRLGGDNPFVIDWVASDEYFLPIATPKDLRIAFPSEATGGGVGVPGSLLLATDGAYLACRGQGAHINFARLDGGVREPMLNGTIAASFDEWTIGRVQDGVLEVIVHRKPDTVV